MKNLCKHKREFNLKQSFYFLHNERLRVFFRLIDLTSTLKKFILFV